MKKNQLTSAILEFNKVVELDYPVNPKSKTAEKDMYEALKFIEEGDEFTKPTLEVFDELKIKYTPRPKTTSKPKTKKTVEVGTTVELNINTDKVKTIKNSKMKKESSTQMEAARLLLSRDIKKDELMQLLEDKDLYSKKDAKQLKTVGNFLSLKKQMTDALDPEIVAEVKKEIAASKPKTVSKSKVKKDSPLVAEIKKAIKVKELKKIAKANDQFNWKKLKGLEFDEMQKAMLKGAKPVVKAPAKPKMIPNPVIAEINEFSKAKKLVKWVKATDGIEYEKSMKKMDLDELKEKLIAEVPAKIEMKSKSTGERIVRNHIDQEARKKRVAGLIKEGKYTRKELMAILLDEFPEEGKAHTNSNILSECKNPNRWERYGNFGELVVVDEKGRYRFASDLKKKSGKKDKKAKGKKGKK